MYRFQIPGIPGVFQCRRRFAEIRSPDQTGGTLQRMHLDRVIFPVFVPEISRDLSVIVISRFHIAPQRVHVVLFRTAVVYAVLHMQIHGFAEPGGNHAARGTVLLFELITAGNSNRLINAVTRAKLINTGSLKVITSSTV